MKKILFLMLCLFCVGCATKKCYVIYKCEEIAICSDKKTAELIVNELSKYKWEYEKYTIIKVTK